MQALWKPYTLHGLLIARRFIYISQRMERTYSVSPCCIPLTHEVAYKLVGCCSSAQYASIELCSRQCYPGLRSQPEQTIDP